MFVGCGFFPLLTASQKSRLRLIKSDQRRPSASTTKHNKSCRAAAEIAGGRKGIGETVGKQRARGRAEGSGGRRASRGMGWVGAALPARGRDAAGRGDLGELGAGGCRGCPGVGEAREYLRRVRPCRAALPAPRTRDPPRTLRAPFPCREPTRQTPVSWASGGRRGAAHRRPGPGSSPAPRGSAQAPCCAARAFLLHVEACGVSLSAPAVLSPPSPAQNRRVSPESSS